MLNCLNVLQLICTGTYYEEWDTEEKRVLIAFFVSFVTILGYIIFTCKTIWHERKYANKITVVPFNQRKQESTNLGTKFLNCVPVLVVLNSTWIFLKFNR